MISMGVFRSTLLRSDPPSSEKRSHLRHTKKDTRYVPNKNDFVNSLMKTSSEMREDIRCSVGVQLMLNIYTASLPPVGLLEPLMSQGRCATAY